MPVSSIIFLPSILIALFAISTSVTRAENPDASDSSAIVEGSVPLPESPSPAIMAKRYEIVSKGGALSTIPPVGVVWLEGDFPPLQDPPVVEMNQEEFMFTPSLLTIRPGTVVAFPNNDEEYHNVFSYSPTERFDLGRYLPDERPVPTQVFDEPGMVTIRCDIHEHMRAIILVIDSPHFVTTDTKGRFRLENLPAGTYTLKAWINSRETLERSVVLKAGETTTITFSRD